MTGATMCAAHAVGYVSQTCLTLLDMGGAYRPPPSFFKGQIVKKTLSAKNL